MAPQTPPTLGAPRQSRGAPRLSSLPATRAITGGLATALLTLAASAPAWSECAPARSAPDAPAALVLSGGGAKGAWEAGVATALVERGVPIRLAAGSSAGALNATLLADGRLDRLETVWRTITRDQVYRLRPSVFFAGLLPGWLTALSLGSTASLLDPEPLRELIARSLDLARVRASPMRVVVVATDLVRREKRVFDNAAITADVLMAAAAVPGLFPPVAVDGDWLVDGGLIGRAPVLEALEAGVAVRRAIVLVSYADEERGRAPASMRVALEEAFETAMIHQIRRDAELARARHPDVEVLLVTPSAPIGLRPLDFDPERTAAAFERGRADGGACVKAWRATGAPTGQP